MGLWKRIFGGRNPQPVGLAEAKPGTTVALEGRVEAITELISPVDGEPGVAMAYDASAPSAVSRAYAGLLGAGVDIRVRARQAVDFLLRGPEFTALIRVEPGDDVDAVHQDFIESHGVNVRATTEVLASGDRVRVVGEVLERPTADPHRGPGYDLVIAADDLRRATPS